MRRVRPKHRRLMRITAAGCVLACGVDERAGPDDVNTPFTEPLAVTRIAAPVEGGVSAGPRDAMVTVVLFVDAGERSDRLRVGAHRVADDAADVRVVEHRLDADPGRSMADGLGVVKVPTYFVNGVPFTGAHWNDATWAEVVEVERANARRMLDRGVPRAQIYESLMRRAEPRLAPDDLNRP